MTLHGLDVSYFTGKMEAFLRYKEIPYRRVELTTRGLTALGRKTGLAQMPAIELADGRWMSDSTPMIALIDTHVPGAKVQPACPVQLFFSRLLEDYADEWLWRPALYYRWQFEPDARLLGHRIAAEMMHDIPLPLAIRRKLIRRRQYKRYVSGDGVTAANRAHVESIYTRNLAFLQTMLAQRPFLLGARPTLADFGFFGPMFRHFSLDPTPSRIMRDTAPAVYEWTGRMWNARASQLAGALHPEGGIPDAWEPVLRDIAKTYLPYLNANAACFARGARNFDLSIERNAYYLPVHRYRVWCLQRLQGLFAALPPRPKLQVEVTLRNLGLYDLLFAQPDADAGFDPLGKAPYFDPAAIWLKPQRG
jgi:glutathione S-transferase